MKRQALDRSIEYINSWLKFRYERTDMPGFAVAIGYKGEIIFNQAFGLADLEKKEKLTTDHLFRIASHSKTFTATAIMQLVEKGKLALDDPVVKYLPWLKEHKDPRFQSITIRQVLSHGSGIIRDGLDADYWQVLKRFPKSDEFKKEFLAADLIIDSNIKLKYSNFAYSLLGLVVESVAKQSYNDYIKDAVVNKLGLKNTGPEFDPSTVDRLVSGHTRRDFNKKRLPIAKTISTNAMSPATGFYSNASDLALFFSAHIIGSGKLLSDESKKEMQKTHWNAEYMMEIEDYGLGLEISFVKDNRQFGHSGGFPGQSTNSFCDPVNELVVVVLTNCIDGVARSVSRGILSTIYYFDSHTPNTKPKQDLSKFEGRFVSLWDMGDIVSFGNKLVYAYPDSWFPFAKPEKLEFVDNDTLKVVKTNSFHSLGENINYSFGTNKKVTSIKKTGTTMLPYDEYFKKQSKLKSIEL